MKKKMLRRNYSNSNYFKTTRKSYKKKRRRGRGLNIFAKPVVSGQKSAQTDPGRFFCLFSIFRRVQHGSVVKCLTRIPWVLGSSRTGSSGFLRGSVLGQDTSEPSLVPVKPRKNMNNVNCRRDMTKILLKAT